MVANNGQLASPQQPQRMRMPGIASSMVQRVPAITTPTNLTTPHDPLADVTRKRAFPQLVGPDGLPLQGKDKDERATGLAVPHVMTFIARMTGGWGSYWHGRYDECLKFNREYANTMRNDAFLSALLWERMCAVYKLIRSWHLEIPNAADPFQVRVRDAITATIRSNQYLGRIVWCLLDALWFGRQAAQIQWGWTASPDPNKNRALTVLDWQPIQGDKIGHQFIDIETQHYIEQPYILIDGGRVGWLKDHGAKLITTTMGWAMTLQGEWRERFIIHRHLIEDSDWWSPEKADSVHGLGIRSKIFWANWLKWEWLANITDFFDRVGLGITVWRYPQGNAQALSAIQQAANDQSQRAHIFVPVAEGTEQHQSGIERIEVPSGGSEFLYKMIEYIDGYIQRYVVGQEASSQGSKTGLGGQGSQFQEKTKSAITMFDADMLAQTLTGSDREPGLLNTMVKYTYPEVDFPLVWRFDQEDNEDEKKLTSIKTLVDMGVKVKADDARSAAGLSKPIEGDEIIQPPQQPGMPPGAPPGMGGSPIAQPGQGGTTQQPQGDVMGGAGGSVAGGMGGASAPGAEQTPNATPQNPAEDTQGTENAQESTNWVPANTGVSPETGKPLSDSRYVNAESGKVKHFPDNAGEGENGKPIAGQRLQTTTPPEPKPTEGIEGQPAVKENAGSAVESPPQEKPRIEDEQNAGKRLTRDAFEYTDHASMLDQTCSLCRFFDGQKSQCRLFEQLNSKMPMEFDLQVQVKPTGWCDQWSAARKQEGAEENKTVGGTEVPAATQTEGPHQYSRDDEVQ